MIFCTFYSAKINFWHYFSVQKLKKALQNYGQNENFKKNPIDENCQREMIKLSYT